LNQATRMRRDWDDRARKNAFHYIASWRGNWELESFLSSGEEDFERLVAPILRRNGLPATGEAMLELGCGAGRMTHSFARRFKHVYALDISPQMLQRAKKIHSDKSNIGWLLGNGANLACVKSNSLDFVFSYLVLQHLPGEALIRRYLEELLRVLRPDGAFLFQFNGGLTPTMNWRGRIAWGFVDVLWSARLRLASSVAARAFGFDPCAAGKSWRGVAISAGKIAEIVTHAGGRVLEISGANTPMAWCCGSKLETVG
jgi:ubiquinone/menaquinone biosynthesis C-methylase UbiE